MNNTLHKNMWSEFGPPFVHFESIMDKGLSTWANTCSYFMALRLRLSSWRLLSRHVCYNNDNDNDNDTDNNNDIFIILTGKYIAKLLSIISLKLLRSPEGLISQFKISSVHNLCFCMNNTNRLFTLNLTKDIYFWTSFNISLLIRIYRWPIRNTCLAIFTFTFTVFLCNL